MERTVGYPRKSLVCLDDTPYYHVIARCVRRAWLWGLDEYSGKDYSHRKTWVIERLQALSGVFAIDICAYAVMSNHYHLVLHVDRARAAAWAPEQIVERWALLFGVPTLVQRWQASEAGEAEQEAARAQIEHWRARLSDISWYMRCLNEHLARRANAEDQCTGRFWEGRFKSQALLDEAGLLTAMAYVDLNPVRAGMAATPEASEFTSIYARIQQWRRAVPAPATASDPAPGMTALLGFRATAAAPDPSLPFRFIDYLQLLDWSGRVVRVNKAGAIDEHAPPILMRLSIDPAAWQAMMRPTGNRFGRALGGLDRLRLHAKALGQCWIKGQRQAERLYRSA
jgi:REP element-mobilizing transposase RayT